MYLALIGNLGAISLEYDNYAAHRLLSYREDGAKLGWGDSKKDEIEFEIAFTIKALLIPDLVIY